MFKITKTTEKDINELAHLFDLYRIFYEQESNLKLARSFIESRIKQKDSEIFVAKWENQLVGFVQLYPIFSSVSAQKSWILNDLYVLEKFRGQGIATQLLEKSKELTKETEAKGLALETARDNPAQKLYERLGWVKDEEFLHYFWKA